MTDGVMIYDIKPRHMPLKIGEKREARDGRIVTVIDILPNTVVVKSIVSGFSDPQEKYDFVQIVERSYFEKLKIIKETSNDEAK